VGGVKKMPAKTRKPLSNHEIVTVALYMLRGDAHHVDTEDVAVKANELAPGRFTWRKYPSQINIETVRKRLWDARKPEKGAYLVGSDKTGWLLTAEGVRFAMECASVVRSADLARGRHSLRDRQWLGSERVRMLSSDAYQKITDGIAGTVTVQEAEEFFRIDDYVVGRAREEKIVRALSQFGGDPDLGDVVKMLATKVRRGST